METTDKKSALSPEEWLRIIEECKASDLPVTEYCAQTGVGVSHYYRWRRRLHGKSTQSKIRSTTWSMCSQGSIPIPLLKSGNLRRVNGLKITLLLRLNLIRLRMTGYLQRAIGLGRNVQSVAAGCSRLLRRRSCKRCGEPRRVV